MTTDVYNKGGDKVGTVELSNRVFGVRWNANLVHQALRVQTVNRRRNTSHTKDRSEVRGGGKKPWRQKGTGRARHGSIRSPIWVGGGVTHGPRNERSYSLSINKKMRQKALFIILSRRLTEGEVKVVDKIDLTEPRTKLLSEALQGIDPVQNALIITDTENKHAFKAANNLPKVSVVDSRALNVYDLLRHKLIIIEKGALDVIEKHYHAVK